MFADPRLPATGGKWYCPIPGCSHTIDFYNLRDDAPNIDEISVASRRRIQQGGWSWGDPNVVRSLVLLASAHYRDHLDRLGIEMRGTGMRVSTSSHIDSVRADMVSRRFNLYGSTPPSIRLDTPMRPWLVRPKLRATLRLRSRRLNE